MSNPAGRPGGTKLITPLPLQDPTAKASAGSHSHPLAAATLGSSGQRFGSKYRKTLSLQRTLLSTISEIILQLVGICKNTKPFFVTASCMRSLRHLQPLKSISEVKYLFGKVSCVNTSLILYLCSECWCAESVWGKNDRRPNQGCSQCHI